MSVFLDTNVLVAAIVDFLANEAAQVVQTPRPVSAAVDADDAVVLGDALGGNAQAFVTGDANVFALEHLGGMRILAPRAFWEMLQAENPR